MKHNEIWKGRLLLWFCFKIQRSKICCLIINFKKCMHSEIFRCIFFESQVLQKVYVEI